MIISILLNLVAILLMPFLLIGVINRVKSLWSGRRGAPLLQSAYDVIRLSQKRSVYSKTTTPLFRIAPYVFLVTALGTACIVPLLGAAPIASFRLDFIWLAYLWGLGRVASMLAALDTGSSFEGMGAAREATFATLVEPALFLVVGALCLHSQASSMGQALIQHVTTVSDLFLLFASVTSLLIVLQAEVARMPIDDPTTHLELTMVHEVMVLDHSGPELAAIQAGAALKLFICASMISTLLNPWAGSWSGATIVMNLVLSVFVSIFIGTIESLIARLKLNTVPQYIAVAIIGGVIALLATSGGTQ